MGKLWTSQSLAKAFQIHPPLFPLPHPSLAGEGCCRVVSPLGLGGGLGELPQSKGTVTQTWPPVPQAENLFPRKKFHSQLESEAATGKGLSDRSLFAQSCPVPLHCPPRRFRLVWLRTSHRAEICTPVNRSFLSLCLSFFISKSRSQQYFSQRAFVRMK